MCIVQTSSPESPKLPADILLQLSSCESLEDELESESVELESEELLSLWVADLFLDRFFTFLILPMMVFLEIGFGITEGFLGVFSVSAAATGVVEVVAVVGGVGAAALVEPFRCGFSFCEASGVWSFIVGMSPDSRCVAWRKEIFAGFLLSMAADVCVTLIP